MLPNCRSSLDLAPDYRSFQTNFFLSSCYPQTACPCSEDSALRGNLTLLFVEDFFPMLSEDSRPASMLCSVNYCEDHHGPMEPSMQITQNGWWADIWKPMSPAYAGPPASNQPVSSNFLALACAAKVAAKLHPAHRALTWKSLCLSRNPPAAPVHQQGLIRHLRPWFQGSTMIWIASSIARCKACCDLSYRLLGGL